MRSKSRIEYEQRPKEVSTYRVGGMRLLCFKQKSDLDTWRAGDGDQESRNRISLFNAISESVTGKSAVVTSWHRSDGTFHDVTRSDWTTTAIDFRTRIYDDDELRAVLRASTVAGLPAVSLYRGEPHQHIHCGDLMTKVFEVDDTSSAVT